MREKYYHHSQLSTFYSVSLNDSPTLEMSTGFRSWSRSSAVSPPVTEAQGLNHSDRGARSLNLKKTRIPKWNYDRRRVQIRATTSLWTSPRLSITKQDTQLLLTNRATHLCKCNGVSDLKAPPHMCYHVKLDSSATKNVRINRREPQNWGVLWHRSLRWGCRWPLEIRSSPHVLSCRIWSL